MQVPDLSIRQRNRQFIEQNEDCRKAISEMRKVEAFLDDFGTLSSGRDFVLYGKHAFSLQVVSAACELTVGSIISCYEAGCMADANSLLRKYRDDLFFYLYVMICDSEKQPDGKSSAVIRMEENIEKWINDGLSDLPIGAVLQSIGRSPRVKEAVQKYHLQTYFDGLGTRLNNYVHSNGVSFYNKCVYAYRGTGLQQQMQDLLKDLRFITITFLFLLALCSPLSISSSDYVDRLDCNMTPPEGLEYWVAPFIAEFIKNNIELIDESCLNYLKENTLMEI